MADLRELSRTFVDLADTLVDEFDVLDLLHVLTGRCVELLGVDAAGVMIADSTGQLRLAAASSERARRRPPNVQPQALRVERRREPPDGGGACAVTS